MKRHQSGFSVIEVILAGGIFVLFASGIMQAVTGSFLSNRQGEEQTIANQFASEGMDALRSIKNQSFALLATNATLGATQSAGIWTFSGVNNQFGPSNKYTRVLSVADVSRDVSGNVVASGGTADPDTKKVTSTVTWNASPTRLDSVVLSSYMSDFRKSIISAGGLIIYGDGTTVPKYRTYDSTANTFSSQVSASAVASGFTFTVRTSPTKTEAVAGFVTAAGVLNVQCFDGTSWVQEWSATVGGTGTTRPFDIAYETTTGNVIVLYSTNAVATNELAYRRKLGSAGCGSGNWSAQTLFNPARTSGAVRWVKMASDIRSGTNLIAAQWADASSDLSAVIWSGSAWGNEPAAVSEATLEVIAVPQDIEDFDIAYESLSGDVMMVWANAAGSNGVNGVRYRVCTGGTAVCSWGAVTTPPTFADDATNLSLSANPNSDQMVFASIGNAGSDLQIGYWSGTAWTNTANVDTSCSTPVAGSKKVATGWLTSGGTTRSIVLYGDQGSNAIDWRVGNLGVFASQVDVVMSPAPNAPSYLDVKINPLSKDQLMYTVGDGANDVFAKRLVMSAVPAFTWTNSDGVALGTTTPQIINSPFSFAYWRN